jgi:SAM-dependent methyltransferase
VALVAAAIGLQKPSDQPTGLDAAWISDFGRRYMELGPETKDALLDLLPEGWSFEGKRVLDFGCGGGRTLQHFVEEAESAEFWGADIDASSIELVRAALCPPMHAVRCAEEPPLELGYASFDLIWAISVFTHLNDTSLPWLRELHRLLKPGGLLIATYMGRWHSELLAGEPWDEDRVGMNVLRHNQDQDSAYGVPQTMISDWWLREHWGRAFEVLEIAPRIHYQSWALLRKRDVEISVEELAEPADDPREYRAVRHNLRQAQREIELTQQHGREQLEEVRRGYEESRSWRVTRPLRAAGRVVRSLRARLSRARR